MLPIKTINYVGNYKFIPSIKYGPLEKYYDQIFDFVQLIQDHNEWMVCSPLVNPQSAKRVKGILSQLKIKNDKTRKGPSVSATFYDTDDIKLGNNGKLWIKGNGKWNEIKEDPSTLSVIVDTNSPPTWIEKIPHIATWSKKGVFIKTKKINGNKTIVTILSIPKHVKQLQQKI
jgi:hypothetical protein